MLDWLLPRQADRWIHYYRKGTILIELEQYDEAIRVLKKALELRPTQGDVYFALGLASVRRGRLSEAIRGSPERDYPRALQSRFLPQSTGTPARR